MDDLNNRTFVERIRQGDAEAFEILFNRLVKKLPGFLAAEFGLCSQDAEEIAAAAMFKVHKAVAGFNPDGGAKLTTWIFEIAKRTAIDDLRKKGVHDKKEAAAVTAMSAVESPPGESYEMTLPYNGGDDSPDESSPSSPMRRAWDSLTEQDRDILRMRRVMEYEDITKVENISVNAARVRHLRADERLREAYEREKGI